MTADEVFNLICGLPESEAVKLAHRLLEKPQGSGLARYTHLCRGEAVLMSYEDWSSREDEKIELRKTELELLKIKAQRRKPKKGTAENMRKVAECRKANGQVDWKRAAKAVGVALSNAQALETLKATWRRYKRHHCEQLDGG